MPLPYQIATLLYCFDQQDRVLLMERARQPNLGQWSPPGGKLHQDEGESPFACARREATEELGFDPGPDQFHLTGMISEHGYAGQAHWLMFLFELRAPLATTPPPIGEGRFQFFNREQLDGLALPRTDREQIWPLFWKHRGGFFAAHCRCQPGGRDEWTIEQSQPLSRT